MRHVMAVCQSNKKARTRVARVLDRYLWRVGQFTWRGRASNACLSRMSEDLRKGASRATAVAVHEVKDKSMYRDPIFVVGSRSAFGPGGIVPLSVRSTHETDNLSPGEKRARAILLIAAFAHDIGKAGMIFQGKMDQSHGDASAKIGDPVRHELISAAVWDALFGGMDDAAFMRKLAAIRPADIDAGWGAAARTLCDVYNGAGKGRLPFRFLAARGAVHEIGLLILGHHKLAGSNPHGQSGLNGENHINLKAPRPSSADFAIAPGTPFWHDETLLSSVRAVASDLEHPSAGMTDLTLRTCLMIADHIGSSEKRARPDRPDHVANLIHGEWADDLLTHTRKVMNRSRSAFYGLVRQRDCWPSLSEQDCPPALLDRSPHPGRFAWQSEAVRTAARVASSGGGFFCCVIAGTGTGKTRGVPAILAAAAFSDPDPARQRLRFSLGLGLRTLASQSARSYVKDIGFSARDVRFVVGSPIIDMARPGEAGESPDGSESLQNLADDLSSLPARNDDEEGVPRSYFVDEAPPALLANLAEGEDRKGLLASPVLVCTIDQIAASASSARSGHLMAAARIMTSDLLIDEVDQFSAEDLTVLYRIIRQSAASGRRVILSSATLPKDVALNAHAAYRAGWSDYAEFSGAPKNFSVMFAGDKEGSCVGQDDCSDPGSLYDACVTAQGAGAIGRISGVIECAPLPESREGKWDAVISMIDAACREGHDINAEDIAGFRVSAGFVRLSKVRHVTAATKRLSDIPARPGVLRKIVCLHSRMTEGGRALIESELRLALTRKGPNPHEGLRSLLERRGVLGEAQEIGASEISLVVICSPVIETGNDLDFDYAVLDPTDARSVIQAAGRVRRHREGTVPGQNVFILPAPLVVVETGKLAYPGIETPVSKDSTKVAPPDLGAARNTSRDLFGGLVTEISPRFVLRREEGVCLSADKEAELRERFVAPGPVASISQFLQDDVVRSGSGRLHARRFRRVTQAECEICREESGAWVIPGRKLRKEHALGSVAGMDAPCAALIRKPLTESLGRRSDIGVRRLTSIRLPADEDALRAGSVRIVMSEFYGSLIGNQDLDSPFGIKENK